MMDFLFSLRGLVNTKEATLPENISAKKKLTYFRMNKFSQKLHYQSKWAKFKLMWKA